MWARNNKTIENHESSRCGTKDKIHGPAVRTDPNPAPIFAAFADFRPSRCPPPPLVNFVPSRCYRPPSCSSSPSPPSCDNPSRPLLHPPSTHPRLSRHFAHFVVPHPPSPFPCVPCIPWFKSPGSRPKRLHPFRVVSPVSLFHSSLPISNIFANFVPSRCLRPPSCSSSPSHPSCNTPTRPVLHPSSRSPLPFNSTAPAAAGRWLPLPGRNRHRARRLPRTPGSPGRSMTAAHECGNGPCNPPRPRAPRSAPVCSASPSSPPGAGPRARPDPPARQRDFPPWFPANERSPGRAHSRPRSSGTDARHPLPSPRRPPFHRSSSVLRFESAA